MQPMSRATDYFTAFRFMGGTWDFATWCKWCERYGGRPVASSVAIPESQLPFTAAEVCQWYITRVPRRHFRIQEAFAALFESRPRDPPSLLARCTLMALMQNERETHPESSTML